MKIFLLLLLSLATITVGAQNVKQALQQTVQAQGIAQELDTAPDGVAIRLLPDGGFQIFAAGTGSYDFDDVDDVLDAQKEATLKAKANLAKFMNESLSTDEKIESASKKVKFMSSRNDKATASVNKVLVKNALSSIKNSSAALLKGVIVLSSSKIPGKGTKGTYRVMVGVSSKTLDAREKMEKGIAQASTPTEAPVPPAATSKTGVPEGWIECIGCGTDRKTAVIAALSEGIQQVYGISLQKDARIRERMKKLKFNTKVLYFAGKDVESNTLTQTAGFVRQFRIISVKELGGGKIEAVLHALIVNPRMGGVVAIMLHKPDMSLDNLSKNFDLGPKRRLAGSEIATVVGKAFNRALVNANKFFVLDMEDLAKVAYQQKMAKSMVDSGLAPSSELMKAGRVLTADYILTSRIEDLKYSRKIGWNEKTNKFVPIYKMSIRMNYKLTDVTNGRSLLSNEIEVKLDSDEITALLDDNEDADLLLALMKKVTTVLSGSMPQK